ncbi:MAG: NADH-quinone oxidoreductase subunit H [Candidatus Diapherotrites archaeon]|nr:NADH-quinone oxidoreductase subunit H [Candidatus Diapherotrites archaeon]
MIEFIYFGLEALIIILLALFIALLFNGIERKLIARMQARIGPPITQPFIDVKKLFIKENIVPDNAIPWIFNAMPLIALASSLLVLLYIPFGGMPALLQNYGDLILVVYIMLIPSLALAIGAFASGSPYASIGAQREIVIMISYEFVLSVIVIAVAWLFSLAFPQANAFSFATINEHAIWSVAGPVGIAGLLLLFISSLAVMPAKIGKLPIDIAEAKTEIADGVLVEYSGRNLALLHMAQATRMFAFASLIVALFLPWNLSNIFSLSGTLALIGDFAFFLAKVFVIMFVSGIFVSAASARLKIDQAAKCYISFIFLLSLIGLMLIGLDIML